MNVWKKRLIMFCIGLAMGSAGIHFYKGNIAAGIGFVVAAIYAIGWRIECIVSDSCRMDAEEWEIEAKKSRCGHYMKECLADTLKHELQKEKKKQ